MKQTITPEQFDELSEKGKREYLDWCIKKGLYRKKGQKIYSSSAIIDGTIPFLSIGQMIEFLDEENKGWKFDWKIEFKEFSAVSLVDYGIEVWYRGRKMKEKYELCDALFEAVKEVLEK